MGDETLGLRSLGAEAVVGDSAMFSRLEETRCEVEERVVFQTRKEKREEGARGIGGLELNK
jgi:hypothetical protein